MKFVKVLVFILLPVRFLFAQEVIDRVVAIVDNEIILKSELDLQTAYEAVQRNLDPDDPQLKRQILNLMIDEKLLYAQAELDSIIVSDEEVEQQLDYQLNFFIQQYGSRERVEQIYGMSIDKIKREQRSDVRKKLMAQRVQAMKFANIEVTRREVEEFFETYEDSLGLIPEKLEIAHIFINPTATKTVRNRTFELAEEILDSLKNGADFARLAKEYSDDPGSASEGGDLGFVKRGIFFPEFEAAAFALEEGELSDVVESPVGLHIIQLIERRGESIHTRHILLKIKSDDEADLNSIEFLTNIRDSVINGDHSFDYYARMYSDDTETANKGGLLGTFEVGQLDKSLLDVVYKLKVGEISYPKRLEVDPVNYGYHIVHLIEREPEHKPSLAEDFNEIKKLAEFNKKQKLYQNWIKEIKNNIYWEIRI
jgi:peptidyl-prolyl cis-trans isomerase SurA